MLHAVRLSLRAAEHLLMFGCFRRFAARLLLVTEELRRLSAALDRENRFVEVESLI